MAQHLAGWTASADQAALAPIATLIDQVLTPAQGTGRYLVPNDRNFVWWGYAGGISLVRAQLVTPSLGTKRESMDIVPHKRGTDETITKGGPELWSPPRRIPLIGTESMEVDTTEDGAGATRMTAFIALGPETLPPIPDGEIRRTRLTGTATLTARAWTLVALTPEVTLEPGTYQLVRAFVYSAGAVVGRFVFQGGGYRPGVPAFSGTAEGDGFDFDSEYAQQPYMGYAMGEFTHLTIPQVEMFSISADTTETVYMDIIRTGAAANG